MAVQIATCLLRRSFIGTPRQWPHEQDCRCRQSPFRSWRSPLSWIVSAAMIAIMAPQLLAGGFAMFDKALPAFMDLSFLTTTRLIHGGAIRLRAIKSLGNVREL